MQELSGEGAAVTRWIWPRLAKEVKRMTPLSTQARRLPSGETEIWPMVMACRWLEVAEPRLGAPDGGVKVWAHTGRREVGQRTSAKAAQRRLRGESGIGKMLTAGNKGARERVSRVGAVSGIGGVGAVTKIEAEAETPRPE